MLKQLLPLILLLSLTAPQPANAASACKDAAFAATIHPDHPRRQRTRKALQKELLNVIALLNTGKLGEDDLTEYLTDRFLAIGITGKGQYSAEERAGQFAREAIKKIPDLRNGPCKSWR